MASAAERLAANINLGALGKAEELKRRIWFTLGALLVFRFGTFMPIPGIDPVAFAETFKQNSTGILGMFNMFAGGAIERMAIFALNIMPYISASIIMQLMSSVDKRLEALEEGRRAGPQADQPVHALPDRDHRDGAGLRHRHQPRGLALDRRLDRDRSGLVLPPLDRDHAGRRHDVPDVARRADHRPRRRQRLLADHLRRHRRGHAAGDHAAARDGPHADAVAVRHHLPAGADAGDRRRHRVLRARAAATADPVSQAPGRQSDDAGRQLASAAEAQLVGRHSADLRLLAAAAADHRAQMSSGCRLRRAARPDWLEQTIVSRRSAAASRCTS